MVLTENQDGKTPLGRPCLEWNDIVKRDVESIGGPDWKTKAAYGGCLKGWF